MTPATISYETSGCQHITPDGKCGHPKFRRRFWHPLYWMGFALKLCLNVRPHWAPDDIAWHPKTCPLRRPRA